MSRPLRIEFAGAVYHVMTRGNAREAMFLDDEDREAFLSNLDRVAGPLRWVQVRLFRSIGPGVTQGDRAVEHRLRWAVVAAVGDEVAEPLELQVRFRLDGSR